MTEELEKAVDALLGKDKPEKRKLTRITTTEAMEKFVNDPNLDVGVCLRQVALQADVNGDVVSKTIVKAAAGLLDKLREDMEPFKEVEHVKAWITLLGIQGPLLPKSKKKETE